MATSAVQTAVFEGLEALAGSHTDTETLRCEALTLLGRALPVDGWAWATSDPASQLAATAVSQHPLENRMLGMLTCEEDPREVNRRVDLATARVPVAGLSLSTEGALDRSLRWRTFMADSGIGDELRLVFADRGGCWGYLDVYTAGTRLYGEEDVTIARAAVRALGDALRLASMGSSVGRISGVHREPAVLIVDRSLGVRARTGPAAQWMPQLYAPPGTAFPCAVITVTARAIAAAQPERAVVRQRTKDGVWATVGADLLDTGDVAITIGESSRGEVLDFMARARGLTPRERQVLALLQEGKDNRQIAAHLVISTTTAHDHVQEILRKTGFSSRQALLAAD